MKRLVLLGRLRPLRPLSLEPRVVLIVDRDRTHRTDPDGIRLVLGCQVVHTIGIDARKSSLQGPSTARSWEACRFRRKPLWIAGMSVLLSSDFRLDRPPTEARSHGVEGRRGRDFVDLAWARSGRGPACHRASAAPISIVAYLRFFGMGSLGRFLYASEGFY